VSIFDEAFGFFQSDVADVNVFRRRFVEGAGDDFGTKSLLK
jgi:hypothetical protein